MMDNFERREIERMYRDGYGPTAISYELEISINTIKSYIRRHPSMKNASRCLYCGKVISQPQGQKVLLGPLPQCVLELQVSQRR